jgi:dipeptidyl aminopeptidase/acylaminoacyl peptidase
MMPHHDSVRQSPIMLKNKRGLPKGIKIGLWLLLSLAILGMLVIVGLSLYVGWSITHPDQKPLDGDPTLYEIDYKEFEVLSHLDKAKLSGWVMESSNSPKGVIVMAHGYKENRLQHNVPALALTQSLLEENYHVILFDFRNSGLSDKAVTTVGFHEKEDLISVVQYVKGAYPELPIGVIGFSMGAATALIAAEDEPSIEAIVADSSFSDMGDYLSDNLSVWSGLPDFPFTPIIMNTLPFLTGIDIAQVSPREAIKNIEAPVMLIHGDGDTAIPYQNSEEIMSNSIGENIFFWMPSGAGHVRGYFTYPEEYTKRVIDFFDQSLIK